jgi:hypothetical protein
MALYIYSIMIRVNWKVYIHNNNISRMAERKVINFFIYRSVEVWDKAPQTETP